MMDLEQEEMQFLGVFGIYLETYKLIFRWRKIFSQITLTLIFPLALIFLANEEVSTTLYWKIRFNEFRLHHTEAGTPKYDKISDLVSSEWATYILLKALYFSFLLIFSLLSTSAVVYTVACAYTSREITYRKVMSVVPKVWKRVMVTFLCTFLAIICYHMLFALTIFLWAVTVGYVKGLGPAILLLILMLYTIGFVYMTIIWQLASVVSVLEDSYGFKAMMKSKDLIKGKMFVATVIFFILNLSLGIIYWVFRACVVFRYWRASGTIRIIGSQEIANSSNRLLSNFTFNPKHGFQCLRNNNKRGLIVCSSVEPGPPAPSGSPFNALSWVLAIAIAAVVPFINYKWGPLLKNKIETTLKMTDDLAEAVKEAAEVVEKVAEDVAEDLPQGGKLKEAVDFVENLAERVVKDTGAIDDFIDKVEEEEKKTESFIESLKSAEFENSSKGSDEEKLIMVEPITSDELKNPSHGRIE